MLQNIIPARPVWSESDRSADREARAPPAATSMSGSDLAAIMRLQIVLGRITPSLHSKKSASKGVHSLALVDLRGIEP